MRYKRNTEQPEMVKPKWQLTDLVSLEKLQQIQDAFAEANQIASSITDPDGVPITQFSNYSKVCRMIRASPRGKENCQLSGQHLGLKAASKMKPYRQMCLSVGFTDAAAPIIVEGVHIANWLIGQYHVGEVDEQRIRSYSHEIGVDEEEIVQAFHEMPKISFQRFEKILAFLDIMANEISMLGYQRLLHRRQSDQLREIQKQLEENQDTLEQKVEMRTRELEQANRNLEKEVQNTLVVQREQQKLLTAIEQTDEGIVITDIQGTILYCNPAMEQLTGYPQSELVGNTPRILQSGYHDSQFYAHFWETLSQGKTWTGRFTNKRKDGALYHQDTTVSSVKDDTGQIINYVAVKRDITHVLEMEHQIQQMSKMEAVGTLAAGVAHEINTPIQYVTDNTLFLQDTLIDYKQLHAALNEIEKEAAAKGVLVEQRERLQQVKEDIDLEYLEDETLKAVEASLDGLERISTIVMAMKDFTHPGSQEKTFEDVNKLIKNTVDVSRNEWKYQANIDLDLEESIPSVNLLSGPIKQVLLNIIINASQAIAEKEHFEKGRIHITSRSIQGGIEIAIRDNGIGMTADVKKKIFEPFFTTKAVGQGTGQGLALAFSTIVDGHGGTIQVFSEPGSGTEFKIILPTS